MTKMRLNATVAAVFLLFGTMVGAARAQDEPLTSATPDIVRILREDVVRDHRSAEQNVDRARRWRELEANARRNAEQSIDPKDRTPWLETAGLYDKYAKDLEDYARKLRAQAEAAEARANRLAAALAQKEEAARPPAPAPPPATPVLPTAAPAPAPAPSPSQPTTASADERLNRATHIAGRYQREPVSGDYPPVDIGLVGSDKVKFAGQHNDWIGTYREPTDTESGKLVFTRKPAAHEMSAKAPKWAREAVAGQLEWRLELDVFECPDFRLVGKWYPGELRWSERGGAREATVSGPGTPVDYTFNRVQREGEFWAEVETAPVVLIASPQAPLARGGLRSTAKQRPFMPVVRANIAWAKAKGNSIKLTLRASRSGGTAEVELIRFGSANSLPVVYMPREPVIIDDHVAAPIILGTPLSMQISKETVRLDVENGEVVTADIDGSSTSFVVYNSWVQEGIANHRRNFEQLNELFQMTIADSVATREMKELALQKSRLIQNFEKLTEYQAQGNENYTDYTRLEIGQAYANLLATFGRPDIEGRVATPLRGPPPDRHGVVYLTDWEQRAVGDAIAAARQRYRDAMAMMGTELVVGTYDFVANMTGAAQFVAVVWAIDTHGNAIDSTDRIWAGIGLGSQLLLVGATTALQVQKLSSETKLSGPWGELLQKNMIEAQKRMAAAERQAMVGGTRAAARPGATSPALKSGTAANMAQPLSENLLNKIYEPHELTRRNIKPMEPLYDGDPTFELLIPTEPLNSGGTPMQVGNASCGLAAAEGGLRDVGYAAVAEKENLRTAIANRNFEPISASASQPNYKGGGMTGAQLAGHLGDHGAVTRIMLASKTKLILTEVQAGLRKGKQYYAGINNGTLANPSWHWVRVEGFTCSQGKAWVHIGDPWIGSSYKIPPKMLAARLDDIVEADWASFKAEMGGTR